MEKYVQPGGASFTREILKRPRYDIQGSRNGLNAAYKGFLLDMDGVLHKCGVPIAGADTFLFHLQKMNVPFQLLTNECRYTNKKLCENIKAYIGVQLEEFQIYSAANSTRDFFKRLLRHGFKASVYVLGEEGLVSNVKNAYEVSRKRGFLEGPAKVYSGDQIDDYLASLKSPTIDFPPVEYVVIGAVHEENTRNKERCARLIRLGAKVVYTCPDSYDAYPDGSYCFGMPAATVKLLEDTCSISAYCLGKPNPHMIRMGSRRLLKQGVEWGDILFVGDSIDTDIRTAIENGIDCALVMSGTTNQEKLNRSALAPSFIFPSIFELYNAYLGHGLDKTGNIDDEEEEE